MTKEQFYINCFTEHGRERIEKEFNTPNTLKQYYKREDLDLSDIANWNQIIYIPKYGKINTFIDDEVDENGEISYEHYGEMNEYYQWRIYTFWDIILDTYYQYEGESNKPSIKRLYKQALNKFTDIHNNEFAFVKLHLHDLQE